MSINYFETVANSVLPKRALDPTHPATTLLSTFDVELTTVDPTIEIDLFSEFLTTLPSTGKLFVHPGLNPLLFEGKYSEGASYEIPLVLSPGFVLDLSIFPPLYGVKFSRLTGDVTFDITLI